jgi:hypothetical protein
MISSAVILRSEATKDPAGTPEILRFAQDDIHE